MPLYHFHVHTESEATDPEGMEYPDLDAAKASAVAGARAIAIEEMRCRNRFSPNHCIRITDALGQLLHTTRIGDCIDVHL